MTEIAVRLATREDAAAIAAVHVESWRVAYEGVFPDAAVTADLERRREAWRRYIGEPSSPGQQLLVATSAGEVVGFGAFGSSRDDDLQGREVGEIYAMYLKPEIWRRGIGRRLLAEVERRLAADGFTGATLWVLAVNARARAFYGATGWVADGAETRESLHSVEVVELRYRRSVAGPGAPFQATEPARTGFFTTGSRTVYENRWMRVREDEIERPDGSAGVRAAGKVGPFCCHVRSGDRAGAWAARSAQALLRGGGRNPGDSGTACRAGHRRESPARHRRGDLPEAGRGGGGCRLHALAALRPRGAVAGRPGGTGCAGGGARHDGRHLPRVEVDLADATAPVRPLDEVTVRLGLPDVLVNNAAHSLRDGYRALDAATLDDHYAVNVRGTALLCVELARRRTDRGGRIVNLTSGQSLGPMAGELAYAASKGAIEAFTVTLAAELAPRGFTVNALNPGPTETGWMTEAERVTTASLFPGGRINQPEGVARVAAFLVSDEAASITGQVIHAEGGFRR